jgi:hypothetical protein
MGGWHLGVLNIGLNQLDHLLLYRWVMRFNILHSWCLPQNNQFLTNFSTGYVTVLIHKASLLSCIHHHSPITWSIL